MKNEEGLETLKRIASRTIIADVIHRAIFSVIFLLAGIALAAQTGVSYVVIPFVVVSLYLLQRSVYYALIYARLLKREKRKVEP